MVQRDETVEPAIKKTDFEVILARENVPTENYSYFTTILKK